MFHVNHIEPATEFEADSLEMTNFLKVKFCMQRDAGKLFPVNAGDDNAVAEIAGVDNQFLQEKRADAAPVILVMDINGVLNGVPVSRSLVISRKRASADHLAVRCRGDDHRVFVAMVIEPLPPAFEWLWFFLIGACRMEHVVVVNVVDRDQVGFGGRAKSKRIVHFHVHRFEGVSVDTTTA